MSLYETLGVDKDATPDQIKRAFRKLAKKHHPDTGDGDMEALAKIQAAYDCLTDPVRRVRYDETGDSEPDNGVEAAKIANLLCAAFSAGLANAGPQFELIDLIANTKAHLSVQIRGQQENIKALQVKIKSARIIMKRLKYRGKGKDVIGESFSGTIRVNEALIEAAEAEIVLIEKARTVAADYIWNIDKPDMFENIRQAGQLFLGDRHGRDY